MGAGQVAAETCNLSKAARESPRWWRFRRTWHGLIEDVDLCRCQGDRCWRLRCQARDHRCPEASPGDNAENRDQLGQPVSGPKPRCLGLAAGFQHLVEQLDFPAAGIPAQLLDCIVGGGDGQVGDELPLETCGALRLLNLARVQDAELEGWVALLLTDRWQHTQADKAQFQLGRADGAVLRRDLDRVCADRRHLADGALAIYRQPIDIGAHQEMGPESGCQAEELEDVGLAVAHMHQPVRRADQASGRFQPRKPAHALLVLDRHARRVDLPFERVRSLELRACPELGGHEA